MKKALFIYFSLMFVMMLGMGDVNADTTKKLIIFDPSVDSVTTNDNGILEIRKVTMKVGEKLQLEAKLCSYDNESILANHTFNKSDCETADVDWFSSSTNHFTVSNSGLVTALANTSEAGLSLQTKLKNTTTDIGNDSTIIDIIVEGKKEANLGDDETNFNSTTISDDEETPLVYKTNKGKKETELVGKQTTSNPKTGIEDIAVYVIPVLLVIGSGLALRKKYI